MLGEYDGLSVPDVPEHGFYHVVHGKETTLKLCSDADCIGLACDDCIFGAYNDEKCNSLVSELDKLETYKQLFIPNAADGRPARIEDLRKICEARGTCAALKCIPGKFCDECICATKNRSVLRDFVDNMTDFEGLRIPSMQDWPDFLRKSSEEAHDMRCFRSNCTGIACVDCLFSSSRKDKFNEWFENMQENKEKPTATTTTITTKGESAMKQPKFTVMKELVEMPSTFNVPCVSLNNIAVELRFEAGEKLEDVREWLKNEANKLMRKEIDKGCTAFVTMLSPDGTLASVLVPYSYESSAKAALEFFEKLQVDSAGQVRMFLRDTGACDAGSRFALRFNSLREVWDAVCDAGRMDYAVFIIGKMNNVPELVKKYGCNPAKIAALVALAELPQPADAAAEGKLRNNVGVGELKTLNPFPVSSK